MDKAFDKVYHSRLLNLEKMYVTLKPFSIKL